MRPYYEDAKAGVVIYHGDSREMLPDLPGAFDTVVTDPPYVFGMASTAHAGKAGGWGDMMNGALFYATILRQFMRLVSNQQGCAWVFNSWRSLPVLMRAAFDAEWPIESLLVWDKGGLGPGGPRGLRPTYEVAALFCSDGFALKNRSLPDIWRQSPSRETDHPAEKPEPLLRRIIVESGAKRVLDPFAGSGTTLVAAKASGVPCVGIEIEERWCETAARRLSQGVLFAL